MADPDRTARFLDQVLALAKAFALCGARDEAAAIRNDVRMFTDVRAAILKIQNPDSGRGGQRRRRDRHRHRAARQRSRRRRRGRRHLQARRHRDARAVDPVRRVPRHALSARTSRTCRWACCGGCINDQIRTVQRTNVVQARRFSEQLDEAINRYTNRALTTAEIIAELVKLAKDMRDQNDRHNQLGLSVAEAAFYDAIVQNDAAILRWATRRSRRSRRPGVGRPAERHDRLVPQGVRASRHALQGPPAARQVRLPARPRGEGHRARPPAGRAVRNVRQLVESVVVTPAARSMRHYQSCSSASTSSSQPQLSVPGLIEYVCTEYWLAGPLSSLG